MPSANRKAMEELDKKREKLAGEKEKEKAKEAAKQQGKQEGKAEANS